VHHTHFSGCSQTSNTCNQFQQQHMVLVLHTPPSQHQQLHIYLKPGTRHCTWTATGGVTIRQPSAHVDSSTSGVTCHPYADHFASHLHCGTGSMHLPQGNSAPILALC
jgi:hypothetical protein